MARGKYLSLEEERLWKCILSYQAVWMLRKQFDEGLDVEKNPDGICLVVLRNTFREFKVKATGDYKDSEDIFLTIIEQERASIERTW